MDQRKNSVLLHRHTDRLFQWIMTVTASVVVVLLLAIFFELISNAWPAFEKFGFGFLATEEWNPVTQNFGSLSSIYGTIVSTLIALIIAVPLSIGIAILLVETLPPMISTWVGSAIELLAAIPSIIYGMWGLFVFAPFVSRYLQPFLSKTFGFLPFFQGPPMGIGMLTAGIILSLMILPYMSSIVRDVFQLTPHVLKESAYGIGATTWEVTRNVTIPYGIHGILGAFFIGLGRALGETMAVTFVIGNSHRISSSLYSAGNSIASTLANEFSEAFDSMHLSSLIALGVILFAITLLIQFVSQWWITRLKKKLSAS